MISKNQIKNITALSLKKNRDEQQLFIAEGTKLIADLQSAFKIKECYATSEWLSQNPNIISTTINEISNDDLKKISNQKSPQGVLAVFEKPEYNLPDNSTELILALDDVQDPGNLGTIIRIADWFGIRHIICSELSADAFGPKTVQSTMGAIARVQVHYVNLANYISSLPVSTSIYGTFMEGEDIYKADLTNNAVIVMGNEGNGISEKISNLVNRRISIPNFPKNEATSESLNVAIAAGIICAEFRRRLI